jgi:hypothetical protein
MSDASSSVHAAATENEVEANFLQPVVVVNGSFRSVLSHLSTAFDLQWMTLSL